MGFRRIEAAPEVLDLLLKKGLDAPLRAVNPLPNDARLAAVSYDRKWQTAITIVFESAVWDGRDQLVDLLGVPLLDPMPMFVRERSVT